MRTGHVAGLLAGLAALTVGSARAQDDGLQPYYWPHRTVGIPVNVARISELKNKPSELHLYYSVNRGAFQKSHKLPLDKMHSLDRGEKGFLFTAERDGDYEFTVQFVYPDGTASPRADELSPQQRYVIDTTPPQVKVHASGNGVEWTTADDNVDPRGITLECKWPTSTAWTPVADRQFRSSDRYAWTLPPGKVLDVRVLAKDRAGNEGISPPVRVPSDGASGVSMPRPGGPAPGGPAGAGGGGSNLPAPRIDYVNTLDVGIDYTIQKIGRSGVKAAHLFVLRNQGSWEKAGRHEVNLKPEDKERSLSLPYKAKEEGTYGFYVIPESAAKNRLPDPRKDDPPMVWVVVDTTAPYVRITGVQVKPGGTRGPLVEITWEAADPNLMPQPISLEWSTDATAAKWSEIKYRLDNNLSKTTGRHTWEVPDENTWKFYVRARAVDKAANTGEHVWGQDADKKKPPEEVIVDLESPAATISKVRGGGTPAEPARPGGSDAPPATPPGPARPSAGDAPPDLPKLPDVPAGPPKEP